MDYGQQEFAAQSQSANFTVDGRVLGSVSSTTAENAIDVGSSYADSADVTISNLGEENGFDSLTMILPNIILSGLSSIIFYYIFIRYTPLNWFINGYKKSWFRPF